MELTNEQRRCMGMDMIFSSWDRVEIEHGVIVYFDEDTIRKIIMEDDKSYREISITTRTTENRTMLCPKTSRGKVKKLTAANLTKLSGEGVYFNYSGGHVIIANLSTQLTYYSSRLAGIESMAWDSLQKFLDRWVEDTDSNELKKINEFANAKRMHCKFQEGDFFRFPIDRTHYGYGRILLDVEKMRKNGEKFWNILMGKPVVAAVYHIITEDQNVDIEILKRLKSCPSQYVMDNAFYYGQYKIVGHEELPDDIDYPIMYGRSISYTDPDKIMFQRGHTYKEIPLKGNVVVPGDFRNNGIGWTLKQMHC